MKVICERGALLEAVNQISGVVAARTPRPQLTCVKMRASRAGGVGELEMSATDTELSLTLRLGRVEVEQEGEALVPADKLRQIVSAEDNEPTLTIETDDDSCTIRGADAEFRLNTFSPADFPKIPGFKEIASGSAKAVFQTDTATLAALIGRTLFAAARENSRYAINGVLLNRDGKKLEMVATDGRRLALASSTLADKGKGESAHCIVPAKALSMVMKLMGDGEEPVHAAVTDTQAVFAMGDDPADSRAVLATNLVEGAFPPYEDVIPKDQDIKVGFDRDVLASAVRRAALLTNEESRGVRMAFNGSEKSLRLSSRSPEMGEAKVDVGLASYNGSDIEIGFNPQFLTDALKVIPDAEVIIELKAANKPGLFRSGNDFVYVVMPVNLS
ncbi:MAG: DNA polymerase III subunit beta [Phycisphaerales bacterium JB040]